MKRASGAKELAETLRNAARRAIRGLDDDGKPLSEIIKDAIKESPLEAIRALSTLIPKQMEVEHRGADPLDQLTDAELDGLVEEARRLRAIGVAAASTQGEGEPSVVH